MKMNSAAEVRIQFIVKKKLMENVTSKIQLKINVIVRYKKKSTEELIKYIVRLPKHHFHSTLSLSILLSYMSENLFFSPHILFTISSVMLFYLSAV